MNWILIAAALIVSFLVFTWLLKVVRATLGTAIAIAVIVLVLQLGFGLNFNDLWQEILKLWQMAWRSIAR